MELHSWLELWVRKKLVKFGICVDVILGKKLYQLAWQINVFQLINSMLKFKHGEKNFANVVQQH
ncbi:hypothetical protein D3C76_1775520 [compost metagenome]